MHLPIGISTSFRSELLISQTPNSDIWCFQFLPQAPHQQRLTCSDDGWPFEVAIDIKKLPVDAMPNRLAARRGFGIEMFAVIRVTIHVTFRIGLDERTRE